MARKGKAEEQSPALATNRSASHEYHLIRRIEAGIVLTGPEVKTARARRVNLKEAYARIVHDEVFLHGAHFSPYRPARLEEYDPVRPRKLLLHAAEIRKLGKETHAPGMTLIPTRMYLKNGRIKVEIALGRGKRQYDKREAKIRKDQEREMARAQSSREVR